MKTCGLSSAVAEQQKEETDFNHEHHSSLPQNPHDPHEPADDGPELLVSSPLNISFSASPNVLFTEGLHLIYSYLQRRSWLTASHTCRQWYHAATTSRFPFFTHIVTVPSTSSISRTVPPPPSPTSLLSLALCSRWYRRHVVAIIFESSPRQSCRNGFLQIFSDCFPSNAMNSFDLQQLALLFPSLTELKGFSLVNDDTSRTKGCIFEKARVKVNNTATPTTNTKGGKVKNHKHGNNKKSAASESRPVQSSFVLAPLASVRLSSLWMSFVQIKHSAASIIDSLSMHCVANLTSLALSALPLTVPFTPLSSLPHLTQLSLPDYMLQSFTYTWNWPGGYVRVINFTKSPFPERIRELSELQHLQVLSCNNYIASTCDHERRFLEVLNHHKIMFPHLQELHIDAINCHNRPISRFWYPLLPWQEEAEEAVPPLSFVSATASSSSHSVVKYEEERKKAEEQACTEEIPVISPIITSSSASSASMDVPAPRLVGIELNPGPPKEIEVEYEPESEWHGNDAHDNEEEASSSIIIAPLNLAVACDSSAASIFTEGLHLIYAYLRRHDWLLASRTCRQWYFASQSSPYPRLPFVVRVYCVIYDPIPFAPLLQLTRQSLLYRRHITSLIFDSDAPIHSTCCNGFWRLAHWCFSNANSNQFIELDPIDLTAIVTYLPRLRQLKGFTLKPIQSDAVKGCIFEHPKDSKVKSKHKGKAASNGKSIKCKAAASVPKLSSQMLGPLAATTRLDTLWFSVHHVLPVVSLVLGSLSLHCPSLTSLAIDSLPVVTPLSFLSSLPRLSHLALPNYLIHAQEIDGLNHPIMVFDKGSQLTERMRELSALTQLRALCLNNQYPRHNLISVLPELLFLEFLIKEKIHFQQLQEFQLDQLHPTEEQYRPLLQQIMPNLKVWNQTTQRTAAYAPSTSLSSSAVVPVPAPRLVGIELNPGPPTRAAASSSMTIANLFTDGLLTMFTFLENIEWLACRRVSRHWNSSFNRSFPRLQDLTLRKPLNELRSHLQLVAASRIGPRHLTFIGVERLLKRGEDHVYIYQQWTLLLPQIISSFSYLRRLRLDLLPIEVDMTPLLSLSSLTYLHLNDPFDETEFGRLFEAIRNKSTPSPYQLSSRKRQHARLLFFQSQIRTFTKICSLEVIDISFSKLSWEHTSRLLTLWLSIVLTDPTVLSPNLTSSSSISSSSFSSSFPSISPICFSSSVELSCQCLDRPISGELNLLLQLFPGTKMISLQTYRTKEMFEEDLLILPQFCHLSTLRLLDAFIRLYSPQHLLDAICSCSSLTHLRFDRCSSFPSTSEWQQLFAHLPTLTHLTFSQESDSVFEVLLTGLIGSSACVQQLCQLDLNLNSIMSATSSQLGRLTQLTHLTLQYNNETSPEIQAKNNPKFLSFDQLKDLFDDSSFLPRLTHFKLSSTSHNSALTPVHHKLSQQFQFTRQGEISIPKDYRTQSRANTSALPPSS